MNELQESAAASDKPHINAAALEWFSKARQWLARAEKAQPIKTAQEFGEANAHRKQLGIAERQLDASRLEHGALLRSRLATIQEIFRGPADSLARAIVVEDERIKTFEREEKARQAEAARKAQAERDAEAKRLRKEAAAREADQRERDEAAMVEAVRLEAEGKIDAADAVLAETIERGRILVEEIITAELLADVIQSAPIHTVAVPLARAGTSRRKVYSAKITDERRVVQDWLDGKHASIAVQVNALYFNGRARELKEAMSFAGVELIIEEKIGG